MVVRDLMTPNPITVGPDTPVFDARKLMLEARIRHVLVVGEERLVGIVTDRDIRLNLPSPATSLSVWEINYLVGRLTVGEVMSRTVLTVDPNRDVRSAARILIDHKIGALPVLDGATLVGIVTDTDLLRALATTTADLAVVG